MHPRGTKLTRPSDINRRRVLLGAIAGTAVAGVALRANATWPYVPGGSFAPNMNVNNDWWNVVSFGAIGDGGSHPASAIYPSYTLSQLQSVYPFATALTNEINWLSIQAAIYAAEASGSSGGTIWVPQGTFVMSNTNSAADGSGTLKLADYSDSAYASSGRTPNFLGAGNQSTFLSWPYDLGGNQTASFTGQIAGTTLSVSAGSGIVPGMWVSGASVSGYTWIKNQLSGTTGGAGTYQVSYSQTVASESMTGSFASTGNPSGRRLAMQLGDYNDQYNGAYCFVQDIQFLGPGVGSTYGASTCQMIGLAAADRANLTRVWSEGFYAGINSQGGQRLWIDCTCNFNYYGAYFQTETSEFGNCIYIRCNFSSNNMAGIACGPYYGLIGSLMENCIFDTQPFGVYKEPWSAANVAIFGTPTTSFNAGQICYDTKFVECQWENVGNAAIGDGLNIVSFTGSISGVTLTTTGSPSLQPGHLLSGNGVAANTFVVSGSGNTWTVSVSQTLSSGTMTAGRSSLINNTEFNNCQMGWWNSAGGSSSYVLANYCKNGLISIGNGIGVYVEKPIDTFQITPGADSIFDILNLASAIGIVEPQERFHISGDIPTLLSNATAASLGGNQIFASAANISPGAVEIDNQGFWKGTVTPTYGAQSIALGSVVNRVFTTPGANVLCSGTPSDDVYGVLVFQANWGIIAYHGEIPVACGSNSISAGQYVRTASGGIVIAASGASDTTSKVIGIAIAASSGGFVSVRLQGLT